MKNIAKTIFRLIVAMTTVIFGLSSAKADPWVYETEVDKMSGKTIRYARLASMNSLSLDFPYGGANYGHFTIRQHPEWGLHVIFSINKGQLMCWSYSPCKIKVKFDNDAPVTFSGSPPEDHETTVAFLSSPKNFIAKAQRAKTILVQVTIYGNGVNTLEFHADSLLEWDKKPTAKGR